VPSLQPHRQQPSLQVKKKPLPQYDKKPLLYYIAPAIWNISGVACFLGFITLMTFFLSGNNLGGIITLILTALCGAVGIYSGIRWEDLKRKKLCPSCKNLVLTEIRFCTGCGFDLVPHCSSCNAIAQPFDRFCPACGAKLKTPSISSSFTSTKKNTHNTSLAKTLTAPTHLLQCPSCHTAIQPGASFCGFCGYSLEQTQIK
jgi:hypothetical protein